MKAIAQFVYLILWCMRLTATETVVHLTVPALSITSSAIQEAVFPMLKYVTAKTTVQMDQMKCVINQYALNDSVHLASSKELTYSLDHLTWPMEHFYKVKWWSSQDLTNAMVQK